MTLTDDFEIRNVPPQACLPKCKSDIRQAFSIYVYIYTKRNRKIAMQIERDTILNRLIQAENHHLDNNGIGHIGLLDFLTDPKSIEAM